MTQTGPTKVPKHRKQVAVQITLDKDLVDSAWHRGIDVERLLSRIARREILLALSKAIAVDAERAWQQQARDAAAAARAKAVQFDYDFSGDD